MFAILMVEMRIAEQITRNPQLLNCKGRWSAVNALNLAENTIIVFLTDHGEMLGAHGMFDKGPYFFDEIVHIPLLIYDPGQRKPLNPDGFVNLRDLPISKIGKPESIEYGVCCVPNDNFLRKSL